MDVDYALLARSGDLGDDGEAQIDDPRCVEVDATGPTGRIRSGMLVVKLRATAEECDREHCLQVRYWGQDGHTIALWRFPFVPRRSATRAAENPSTIAGFQLAGLPCIGADTYRFEIYVDDKHLQTVALGT